MVPKYVAVTPDNRYILVTNWCSFDLSVIDRATFKEIKRIPLGTDPRGIAVNPASTRRVHRGDGIERHRPRSTSQFVRASWFRGVGLSPRHVVLDPTGRYLYATLNGDSRVIKIDTTTGNVVARVEPRDRSRAAWRSRPTEPRSTSSTTSRTRVTKLRASDMSIVQTVDTPSTPDRDHLRARDAPGLGRLLQRRDPRLRRLTDRKGGRVP